MVFHRSSITRTEVEILMSETLMFRDPYFRYVLSFRRSCPRPQSLSSHSQNRNGRRSRYRNQFRFGIVKGRRFVLIIIVDGKPQRNSLFFLLPLKIVYIDEFFRNQHVGILFRDFEVKRVNVLLRWFLMVRYNRTVLVFTNTWRQSNLWSFNALFDIKITIKP